MSFDKGLPDFTDPSAIGLGPQFPQAPQEEPEEIDASQVMCPDGWVIEIRSMEFPEAADDALVGIAALVRKQVLSEAIESAQQKLTAMVESGAFPEPGDNANFELAPSPLGDVVDLNGNPLDLGDPHEH